MIGTTLLSELDPLAAATAHVVDGLAGAGEGLAMLTKSAEGGFHLTSLVRAVTGDPATSGIFHVVESQLGHDLVEQASTVTQLAADGPLGWGATAAIADAEKGMTEIGSLLSRGSTLSSLAEHLAPGDVVTHVVDGLAERTFLARAISAAESTVGNPFVRAVESLVDDAHVPGAAFGFG